MLAALGLTLPVSANAAMWTICNKTPEDLSVAIAYQDHDNQWVSRGWWSVRACGGCAKVLNLSKTETVDQFYRAVSPSGAERITGRNRFCVGSSSFTARNGGRCPSGHTAAGFKRIEVEYSDRNHTSNIVGSVGGRTCID